MPLGENMKEQCITSSKFYRDFKLAATLNGKESSEVIRELIKQYSDKVLNDFDMMEKLNDRK